MSASTLYPFIWKIRRVFQQLRNISDEMLAEQGINPSQRAVLEVLSGEERFSVPQIAKQLTVTRQHIQVLVNELLAKELVNSAENPFHKRSPLISITAKGKKLFAAISESERGLLNAMQPSFSNADIAISLSTLETLEKLLESREWEKK